MKKYTFLFLLILPMVSHCQPNNYYLELKKDGIEVGQYVGKNFKEKPLKEYPYQTENIGLETRRIASLLLSDGNENVLYYFHCLYGGVRFFHKNSLKKLNKNNESHKIISIVWHANYLNYKKNWEQSIEQSHCLQDLFFTLWSMPNKSNSVLGHSMGHRILEGILKGFDNQLIRFDKVIFAASDLDVDVFEHNFKILPEISEKIVLYNHRKDRLLKISAKKHGRKRLGLHALETNDLLVNIENMERIDVTDSSGKRFFRTTNHSYFKGDDLVLEDIRALLEDDLEKRKDYLEKIEGNIWKMR